MFTRDNQDFSLVQANQLENAITDIQVNPTTNEIYFNQFNPDVSNNNSNVQKFRINNFGFMLLPNKLTLSK